MKYIMTLVWSVILVSMLNYVVSSVQNVDFDLNNGLIMSIPVAILVILITAILPNDPVPTPEHH
ncbi:YjzD family protein [Psychrobacillus sp. FJAT-51614]|uniref:YjzD family protein n=1 Tax=Psychrobacillus mangrovi TaxID=3117745 RepID=A0ABU8F3T8_9BACI